MSGDYVILLSGSTVYVYYRSFEYTVETGYKNILAGNVSIRPSFNFTSFIRTYRFPLYYNWGAYIEYKLSHPLTS